MTHPPGSPQPDGGSDGTTGPGRRYELNGRPTWPPPPPPPNPQPPKFVLPQVMANDYVATLTRDGRTIATASLSLFGWNVDLGYGQVGGRPAPRRIWREVQTRGEAIGLLWHLVGMA